MIQMQIPPRCAGYLKALNVRVSDPDMTSYWAAVILADALTEPDLVAVDFDLGTGPIAERDGDALLQKLEVALGQKRAGAMADDDMESLKAFLGSRGVKVSKLPDADAFWATASILWPQTVANGRTGALTELVTLIRSMSKKARQSARANLAKVPAEWRA